MPGEVVRPVSAARSGWATAPSLAPRCSANVRTACSVPSRGPGLDLRQIGCRPAQQVAGFGRQQRLGLVIQDKRPVGQEKTSAINKIEQRLRALLEARHGREQLARRTVGVSLAASSAPPAT